MSKQMVSKLVSRIALPITFILLLASFAFSQEPRDDAKPAEQPKAQDRDAAPRQEDKSKDEAKPPKENAKPGKEETRPAQEERQDPKPEAAKSPREEAKPEAKPQEQEHDRQMQEGKGHPAGKSQRIPDDKFRASFGRQHSFRVQRTVVEGQPRFQYSGYWFVLGDSWPTEWAYTDDCYIDYIDGEYFLFDILHPGLRIALVVTM